MKIHFYIILPLSQNKWTSNIQNSSHNKTIMIRRGRRSVRTNRPTCAARLNPRRPSVSPTPHSMLAAAAPLRLTQLPPSRRTRACSHPPPALSTWLSQGRC
jgi:hypothetical protein